MSDTPTIKRIDPAAVPGLFEKWDMRPVRNEFARANCCCVNTILAIEDVGESVAVQVASDLQWYGEVGRLAALNGLHSDYALGLARGWDGVIIGSEPPMNKRAAHLGYLDGKAAWEACRRAGESAPA